MSAGLARLDLKAGGAVGANEDPELVSLRAGIHFGVGMLHAVMSMVRSGHTLLLKARPLFELTFSECSTRKGDRVYVESTDRTWNGSRQNSLI